MTQTQSSRTAKRDRVPPRADLAFKPLALPALAAAVEAAKRSAVHPQKKSLPAILRKEWAED
jgi:hypothetical protein